MGNLNLEVRSLKNRLATRGKEKVILHEELNKEREYQNGCKHNLKIWRKNRAEVEYRIKRFIKKLQDDNTHT